MNIIQVVLVVVVSAATFVLGLIALVNNHTKPSNKLFAALCGGSGLFTITNFLSDHDQIRALVWSRLTFVLTAFILIALLEFINVFPRRIFSATFSRLITLSGLVIAVLSFFPGFITGIIRSPDHTDVTVGPLYTVFIVFVVLVIGLAGYLLRTAYVHANRDDRDRLFYMIFGLGLTAVILLSTNFILPIFTGTNRYSGFGSYVFIIFTSFNFYAIIRHHLFDVRRLVARSITYLLLLTTLGIAYVAVAFSISQLFFGDATSSLNQTIVYAALSLVLALMFQFFREKFERLTDRIFYHDRYDARLVLDSLSRVMVTEIDIDRLLARSLDTLCTQLQIQFGQLVIFSHDRVYRVGHFGPLPKRLMVAPELKQLGPGMVVADNLSTGERKEILLSHGLRVSLGLKANGEAVGYLLVGDKLSGNSYTKADLELLAIIGKELAVGIANAKAYAEIQTFNMNLQDRVNHATSRLRIANRHLKELDKTKDEFISMASHQLRTPLTTIKGYLSMMTEGDAGKLSPTQREFVGYAFDASERMVNLISDLLNVSRLEAGRFMIQTKPTDMIDMVADEVRQLQQHAINKGIVMTFVSPPEILPNLEIDENKTRQVIMNFIDNAIYYTKTGGKITVKVYRHSDTIRLEVSDNGIGVPAAAKKKLFSKFYRADNAQSLRPDGTGLGLYLARRVIADQNGTIIFKSTEGQGSTFGFELPILPLSKKE
jgi:signal transduction histidine kinase